MLLRKKKSAVAVIVYLLLFYCNDSIAQNLQYSRQNPVIDNPDNLQLLSDIAGTHHLVSFTKDENPVAYIFNDALELKKQLSLPFRFPAGASLRVIKLHQLYYLCILPRNSEQYLFWKVDEDGNCTEMSAAFEKLLASQSPHLESGFQLSESNNELCLSYHTYLPKLEKNVLSIIHADSELHISNTRKIMYVFKKGLEKIQQESLLDGKDLLVLKTTSASTGLQLMKVNIATGLTITNEFSSSGYMYSQCSFAYNNADSAITVSALLTEPDKAYFQKRFVFVSRMNRQLVEQIPFTILKSQFTKNTGSDFLLINGLAGWSRLKTIFTRSSGNFNYDYINSNYGNYYNDNSMTLHQDYTMPDPNYQSTVGLNNLLASFNNPGGNYDSPDLLQHGLRFSLLDKSLNLTSDSLIKNNKDAYTINPDQFASFKINNKDCLLLGQKFRNKVNGLLMVQTNEANALTYEYLPVIGRYTYLLTKAQLISRKAIIIPYLYKTEAGLVKVVMDEGN